METSITQDQVPQADFPFLKRLTLEIGRYQDQRHPEHLMPDLQSVRHPPNHRFNGAGIVRSQPRF